MRASRSSLLALPGLSLPALSLPALAQVDEAVDRSVCTSTADSVQVNGEDFDLVVLCTGVAPGCSLTHEHRPLHRDASPLPP